MASTCTALNLSDSSKCSELAHSSDGLFCRFHEKQCHGLYKGYKIRNAQLDGLDKDPPLYLLNSESSLRNETFANVTDEDTLNVLHKHLFKKQVLLDRVIRARKLHHSRFYSLNLDYGHKAYLDKLTNDKFSVLRALERLERQTAEVLYAERKWFKWVRQQQDEEDAARVKESEIVKKEAKLFRRHWKEVGARMDQKRRVEELKKQETDLEAAYREAQAQKDEETDDEEGWDPIEDAVEDERGSFVDMMRHLLWLPPSSAHNQGCNQQTEYDVQPGPSTEKNMSAASARDPGKENIDPNAGKSKNARKRAKAKAKALDLSKPDMAGSKDVENMDEVRVEVNESREAMRKRLQEGVKYNAGEGVRGEMMAGTIETPLATLGRIPGIPGEEVEKILEEVAEIKSLLLCRLLLSYAAMLPAALRAESVQAFMADNDVKTADLRDVCLRFERPTLQEVRDACADFFRGEDESEDESNNGMDNDGEDDPDTKGLMKFHSKHISEKWRSEHEEKIDSHARTRGMISEADRALVDFGVVNDEGKFQQRKIRIKLCGKHIYNYPSTGSVPRAGWLHYSVVTKNSSLFDAIELCRNWGEFWELNVLTVFNYFPSPKWEQWGGDRLQTQLLQLGFIPYLRFDHADEVTQQNRAAVRSQGARIEVKNVIAGHIKRDDPVSRRLAQYLAMQSRYVVMLVRDAKTGRVLVTPEEEHCWLVRTKVGRSDWVVKKSVGDDLFQQISGKKAREWQFGFTDYYDVIIWDLLPAQPFAVVFTTLQDALIKAHRICGGMDMYLSMSPILRTITRDRDTGRTRDANPEDESIWDDLCHEGSRLIFTSDPSLRRAERKSGGGSREVKDDEFDTTAPPNWYYSDIDAAEDVILFPINIARGKGNNKIVDCDDPITKRLERAGPNWKRFVHDLHSDDESDDYDDEMTAKLYQRDSDRNEGGKKQKGGSSAAGRTNGSPGVEKTQALVSASQSNKNRRDNDASSQDIVLSEDNCECAHCQAGEPESCENWIDESDEEENVIYDTADGDRETTRIARSMDRIEPAERGEDDPETAFYSFLDREKSKIFKQQWHEAVTDPDERSRYQRQTKLIEKLTPKSAAAKDMPKKSRNLCLYTLIWLHVHLDGHKHVWKDIVKALAITSIYFEDTNSTTRKLPENVAQVAQQLADHTSRSQSLMPYSRPFLSNLSQTKETWSEVDAVYKAHKESKVQYDRESDAVIRPLVAHWFKAGVVNPTHIPYPPGSTAVLPSKIMDSHSELLFDWRSWRDEWPSKTGFHGIKDPFNIDLLHLAQKYQDKNGHDSRFALFRVWSHAYFYPLMLGVDNRSSTSFEDALGRSWEWKFVPKDMPGSEWSMQKAVELRFERFQQQFRHQVFVKRDLILVMGKDEEELRKYVLGVIFALQTSPWRMEVDLWKSFVNIGLDFLKGLDSSWLE